MRILAASTLIVLLGFPVGEFPLASVSTHLSRACAGDKGKPKQLPPEDFSLDLPKPEKLFQTQSEESLRREIREQAKQRGIEKTEFPQDAAPAEIVADLHLLYPPQPVPAPSLAVCYQTLYFQDVTRERGLRSWGPVEPLREVVCFYGTTLALPAALCISPPWRYQCWQYPFNP